MRSIPTCAGQPLYPVRVVVGSQVYPHVCGAAHAKWAHDIVVIGLSPRVRGSLVTILNRVPAPRSIPTCAGQPRRSYRRLGEVTVYPRVCGAATVTAASSSGAMGLSPRVRGSRQASSARHLPIRSIPACAGRLDHSPEPDVLDRSIPACAGQPSDSSSRLCHSWVYPHVCGAATSNIGDWESEVGLSPRVRGSRYGRPCEYLRWRSIPTCAGQPFAPPPCRCALSVYPHVCGAATPVRVNRLSCMGLSPRVRGSRSGVGVRDISGRSIPTCAGQPNDDAAIQSPYQVYPHVCGAAAQTAGVQTRRQGLSPRVRGSRADGRRADKTAGSIPTCAGQPKGSTWLAVQI